MFQSTYLSDIIRHVVGEGDPGTEEVKLPPMDELSQQLGVSKGKLREDLIAAQAWGIVEMRPGDGTYVRPFDFHTPVRVLVMYSIARDRKNFDRYYQLRVHLEVAFWEEAARSLLPEDHTELQRILDRAERKLKGAPIEIPHVEHRAFHLLIFSRLDNEFVQGLLRAYWDAYEAVGLNRYFDFAYYEEMWSDHKKMVAAIVTGRYEDGLALLNDHYTLLQGRLDGTR